MAKVTAREATRRWSENLRRNKASIEAGVKAVDRSPTEAAAEKSDKYRDGVIRAVDSGRYQEGLRRVTKEAWIDSVIKKGLPRLEIGVTQAEGKMERFLGELLPYQEQLSRDIKAMPNNTEGDRDQRMLEAVKRMRAFKRRG